MIPIPAHSRAAASETSSGLASRVTSQPFAMEKPAATASMSLASRAGPSKEGVPPPKWIVLSGSSAKAVRLTNLSSWSRASRYRSCRFGPETAIAKSQ